jgi:phage terminase Nu1 subunit (DNA packaging protein)
MPRGSSKGDGKEKLFSVSELSRLTTLDRNTVQKRLANVDPARGRANLKQYRLADALPALIVGADREFDAAKLKKAQADAGRSELRLRRERREVIDVEEARDYLARIIRGMHMRLYTKFPPEIAGALFKCQTRAEVAKVLQVAVGKIFNEFRADQTAFLASDSGSDS